MSIQVADMRDNHRYRRPGGLGILRQRGVSAVNHPPHYTAHPSGIECIDVVEGLGFPLGNCIKYLWRAGLKEDRGQDVEKAVWYAERHVECGVAVDCEGPCVQAFNDWYKTTAEAHLSAVDSLIYAILFNPESPYIADWIRELKFE